MSGLRGHPVMFSSMSVPTSPLGMILGAASDAV